MQSFCDEHLSDVKFEEVPRLAPKCAISPECVQVPLCSSGLNWGDIEFDGKVLNFTARGQPKANMEGQHVLDINLENVEKVLLYYVPPLHEGPLLSHGGLP